MGVGENGIVKVKRGEGEWECEKGECECEYEKGGM